MKKIKEIGYLKYIRSKNLVSNQENDEPKYQHEEKFLLFINMQH